MGGLPGRMKQRRRNFYSSSVLLGRFLFKFYDRPKGSLFNFYDAKAGILFHFHAKAGYGKCPYLRCFKGLRWQGHIVSFFILRPAIYAERLLQFPLEGI